MPKLFNWIRRKFKKFNRRKNTKLFVERTNPEERRKNLFPAKKILNKTKTGDITLDYTDLSSHKKRKFYDKSNKPKLIKTEEHKQTTVVNFKDSSALMKSDVNVSIDRRNTSVKKNRRKK